jgi:hypothetical protein
VEVVFALLGSFLWWIFMEMALVEMLTSACLLMLEMHRPANGRLHFE